MMEKLGKNQMVLKLKLNTLSLSVHHLPDYVSISQACPKASRRPMAESSCSQEGRDISSPKGLFSNDHSTCKSGPSFKPQ